MPSAASMQSRAAADIDSFADVEWNVRINGTTLSIDLLVAVNGALMWNRYTFRLSAAEYAAAAADREFAWTRLPNGLLSAAHMMPYAAIIRTGWMRFGFAAPHTMRSHIETYGAGFRSPPEYIMPIIVMPAAWRCSIRLVPRGVLLVKHRPGVSVKIPLTAAEFKMIAGHPKLGFILSSRPCFARRGYLVSRTSRSGSDAAQSDVFAVLAAMGILLRIAPLPI